VTELSLFTAPASIGQIMDIPDESFSVIEVVRRNVPFLVLDLPHVWTRWVQRTLVASDEVIIVCQPDLASLRNGKNYIDQLKAARPNDNPPRLVMNMSGVPKRPEIPMKDFAAAIGVEPEVILPFEPELFGTAANNGQMISETDPYVTFISGNRPYGFAAHRAFGRGAGRNPSSRNCWASKA
jgi:pilus assembly protein CpaE